MKHLCSWLAVCLLGLCPAKLETWARAPPLPSLMPHSQAHQHLGWGAHSVPPTPHPEAVQLSEAQSLSGEGGRVALQLTGRHAAWGLSRAAWWPESWLGAGLAPAEESLLALDGA